MRGESETTWPGGSGDLFRYTLAAAGDSGDDLGEHLGRLGTAVTIFTDEIDAVRAAIDTARADAKAAGLVLTATAIHLPFCTEVETPMTATPAFAAASNAVKSARHREQRAHEQLWTVLAELSTLADFFQAGNATRPASVARTLYNDFVGAGRLGRSAAANKRLADAALVVAGDHTLPAGLRWNALQIHGEQAQLFQSKVATGQALIGTKKFLQSGVLEVKGKATIPYSGGLIAGAGVVVSISNGTPVDRAVGTGAASLLAGAAVTAGAALLAASPPGWAVLIVSTVASTGVGYAVDQNWDAIKDGAGGVVDDVKHALGW
ncbi:hypothetical protein AB0H12_31065 [Actinosynnema sp. NPDC023794]